MIWLRKHIPQFTRCIPHFTDDANPQLTLKLTNLKPDAKPIHNISNNVQTIFPHFTRPISHTQKRKAEAQ